MTCVKYLLYCYLIVTFILEAGSIANNPKDKTQIREEERRAAERLETGKPIPPISEKAEPRKRGINLANVYKSAGQLIRPGIAIAYDSKDSAGSEHHSSSYEHHRPGSGYGSIDRPGYGPVERPGGSGFGSVGRPSGTGIGGIGSIGRPSHYPDRDGYPGYYAGGYPGGYGGYGHSGNGIFGHSGGGFEYPVGGYGHGTEIEHHGGGGGFKSPFGLKGLLLPLAGIALLGAAAALTANPVLLQLGVVNGRRRRRGLIQDIYNDVYPVNHYVKPKKK